MLVSLVDAAMVGRLHNPEIALAAMGIGVLATWAIVSFFSSLATGTHILIAKATGEGKNPFTNTILISSFYIAIVLGIIFSVLTIVFAHPLSQLIAKDYRVGTLAGEFLTYRFIGLPFFLLTVSFRGFFFGTGNTRIFMYSAILVNILNIIFNYLFIYGWGFIPAMGVAGSGLGSSVATFCDCIFYFVVATRSRFRMPYSLFSNFRMSSGVIREIFRLSLPVSFQNIFILTGFLSFLGITGLIGVVEQAASQAVISSLFLSIMPSFGFGIAAQTLTGRELGKQQPGKAKIYAYQTAMLATAYTFLLFVFLFFSPVTILSLITNDPKIIATAIPVLKIAAWAQVFYSSGIVLASSLQTFGKSKYVMFSEIIANILIFVPVSYYLAVYKNFGLTGAWSALPLYILSFSTFIFLRHRRLKSTF